MSARSFVLNKRRQGNITVDNSDAGTSVRLHGHLIIISDTFDTIMISSCGYRTNTTKTAINRFLCLRGIDLRIVQKKGTWFLVDGDRESIFVDGMILNRSPLDRALA